MNTPPRAAPPAIYLHPPWPYCEAVSPPPPHNSCSSASTTAPHLSPAVTVLRLCCRTHPLPLPPHICWLLFFVIVVSVVVDPPPLTAVACPLLHPPRLFSCRCPPTHSTIFGSPPLRILRISWLLLAVGGSTVVAPPPPYLVVACPLLSCCLQGCRIMYENEHAGQVIYQGIFLNPASR